MADTRLRLLVVDDEPSLRTSLSLVLRQLGYDVRSAGNGFAALSEVREEIPDILLSDLNMPGMSGFELLSVVRRQFPSIPVIAMSGAFSGTEVPHGVPADGFFQKGSGIDLLLKTLAAVSKRADLIREEAPIWLSQNGHDSSGEAYVTIACPECLRTFPHPLRDPIYSTSETNCIHCGASIHYAIAEAHGV
jgi:CheY-like chemotaxis protein